MEEQSQEILFDYILHCFCSSPKPRRGSKSKNARRRRRKKKKDRGRSRTIKALSVNATFDTDSTRTADTRTRSTRAFERRKLEDVERRDLKDAKRRDPEEDFDETNSILEDLRSEEVKERNQDYIPIHLRMQFPKRRLLQAPKKPILKKNRGSWRPGHKSVAISEPRHTDSESETASDSTHSMKILRKNTSESWRLARKDSNTTDTKAVSISMPHHSDTESDTGSETDNSNPISESTPDAYKSQPAESEKIDTMQNEKKGRLSSWKAKLKKIKIKRARGGSVSSWASESSSFDTAAESRMTAGSRMSRMSVVLRRRFRMFGRRKVHRSSQ
eukprot:CAMPEP_0116138472 /NCGR_PEP_ID=MMETSP0329-20121206/12801_1 /TAXON_ID=697910 /ORGANISM="Pseudo-nitzschia arenysensis, Strain B593" /LENGTH=329 /DNA_ID=CAMNT_0003633459 /DNA_START=64 /DNA_END=1053 /DNA_ORIENTATION=+